MPHQSNNGEQASVLSVLRALRPDHHNVSYTEALQIAERQANKLLNLSRLTEPPVPSELITTMPTITVQHIKLVASGASFWDQRRRKWIIQLSRSDAPCRNRFTLAHELKHIIDHGSQHLLYRGTRRTSAEAQAERVADYFAGCLLVPRRLLRRAWHNGIQRTNDLAGLFHVSEHAICIRLKQTRLVFRPPCPPIADAINVPAQPKRRQR